MISKKPGPLFQLKKQNKTKQTFYSKKEKKEKLNERKIVEVSKPYVIGPPLNWVFKIGINE